MAKPVRFSGKKAKPKKGGSTSFDFGANKMTKSEPKAYRKKTGHGGLVMFTPAPTSPSATATPAHDR